MSKKIQQQLNTDEEYSIKILDQLRMYLEKQGYQMAIGFYIRRKGSVYRNIFSTINMQNEEEMAEAAGRISHHLMATYEKYSKTDNEI